MFEGYDHLMKDVKFIDWFYESVHEMYLRGIVDFVNLQSEISRKHSGDADDEDIALAIGFFGVPAEMFFGEHGIPTDNVLLLGMIKKNELSVDELHNILNGES